MCVQCIKRHTAATVFLERCENTVNVEEARRQRFWYRVSLIDYLLGNREKSRKREADMEDNV